MRRGDANLLEMEIFNFIYKLKPILKKTSGEPCEAQVKKAFKCLKDAYNIIMRFEFAGEGFDAELIKTTENSPAREEPCVGELWRHFKGGEYQIIGIAINATNGDEGKYVVYRRLSELTQTGQLIESPDWYVRELGEFMSPVDTEKYPNAKQMWRFKKFYPPADDTD